MRYPTADRLLQQAIAESGHEDFGPGDFREGLEVLLDSLERDGDLHRDTDEAPSHSPIGSRWSTTVRSGFTNV